MTRSRFMAHPAPELEAEAPFSAREILRPLPVAAFVVVLFLALAAFLAGVDVPADPGWTQ